jgi:ABC-type branched-subunit amino acid transport system substrate-binding protein/predicted negative regulator of RcsB-dependent stress response
MKHFSLLFLIIMLFSSNTVEAQSSGNLQKNYRNGKELFETGKYELAMQVLNPLARQAENNPYTEYASYFYALSAFRSGQTDLAKNMLMQIDQKYGNWLDVDEARLWLAKIHFEENDYATGFNVLSKIKNKATRESAENLRRHYLKETDDVALLQSFYEKNPKDKDVAIALAEKIYSQPLVDQNQKLLERIVKQYNLDPQVFLSGPVSGVSQKKDSYKVAVLLPFLLSDISKSRNVGNQFVIDLYEGLRLGHKRLLEQGIHLNLLAYDTRRDSAQTAKLLNLDEMKGMDLIIGPLYPTPSRLVSLFSNQHKIIMINPLSNNSRVIGNNPYSFLFKSSFETQARRAAEFAATEFENKKGIIIYGTTSRDSTLAFTYKKEAEKNGFTFEKVVKVDATDSKKVLDLISGSIDNVFNIPFNSIGHMYITTLDEIIVANVFNGMNHRTDNIAIIGSEEWLEFRSINYEQLERFLLYFIAPNFIDYTRQEVEKFRQDFMENTKTLPSQSAYSGYEAILYAGRMLSQYGTYFQLHNQEESVRQGVLFPAYKFAGSNDNHFVPIIRMIKSDLVMVNAPETISNE